jgi:DUF177 domain-containing protein
MYARPFINSPEFARNGSRISGEARLVEMSRLLEMLKAPHGVLNYTVHGGVNQQGIQFLDIGLVGQCQLICQRCLNGLDYPVRLNSRLMLLDQSGLDALDDNVVSSEEEVPDSILADTHLDVLDLLEEEILLSLPIAPKHEAGICAIAENGYINRKNPNPFSVLETLKRN